MNLIKIDKYLRCIGEPITFIIFTIPERTHAKEKFEIGIRNLSSDVSQNLKVKDILEKNKLPRKILRSLYYSGRIQNFLKIQHKLIFAGYILSQV